MRVEVCGYIASRVSWWIRNRSWDNTPSISITKARVALANSIDPSRVGLVEASIAESGVHSESLATALHSNDNVSSVADTGVAVPDGADNRCALVDGNGVTVSSIEERASWAGAAHIDEEYLSSAALHAYVAIPEGVLRTHTLSHSGVPYSTIAAWLKRHAL